MIDYQTIWGAVLPVFLTIGLGLGARRAKLIPDGSEKALLPLVLNILVPCLVVDNIVGNKVLEGPAVMAWAIGTGFGFVALGTLISYGVAIVFGLRKGEGRRTFAAVCGLQNYGYVAIPVIAGLWPDDRGVMGVQFVHWLGIETAMWTVVVMMLAGRSARLRTMVSGPMIAVVAGVILNFAGADTWIPGPGRELISKLGACALPIALLMIGVTLSELLPQWRFEWRPAVGAILTRLAIIPCAMILIASFLPIADELKRVIAVQASMPSAVFTLVLTRKYGGQAITAVGVILTTCVISLVTIPFAIAIARKVLGV